MTLPLILGLPIPIWGGMLLFVLILLQVLGGMKVVKIPFKCHKWTGIAILILGIFHAVGGLGIWFGWIKIG